MKILFLALIILLSSFKVFCDFSYGCKSNDYILACTLEYDEEIGYEEYCQCYPKIVEKFIPSEITNRFECPESNLAPYCYHNDPYSLEFNCQCENPHK